ncbi:hypothetical protein ACE7GA_12605 [Roseomonas sp. CCTCC AB2023176]|uniref:hypothetical protein n=1 Tax=Roseomonas sp. CCTCC AB2023176 TaxID=3342640 RepID=UPI0035DF1B3B
MHIPPWLAYPFLPIYLWPITLPLLVVLLWLAVRFRGRRRWFSLAGMAILIVPPLLEFGFLLVFGMQSEAQLRAERTRTESVLVQEATFDGMTFPAGTHVTWSTPAHTHWTSASFPQPVKFHGLSLRGITRQAGTWYVRLAAPTQISGWDCSENAVVVNSEGELVTCGLSRTMVWKGWALPALAQITPDPERGTVEISIAPGARADEAQGIGRPLPQVATLNEDGSLARAYVRREAPLRVAGVPLWANVTWHYDPATHGQGVDRPAIAVEGKRLGSALAGQEDWQDETVLVSLPDGHVTRPAPSGP